MRAKEEKRAKKWLKTVKRVLTEGFSDYCSSGEPCRWPAMVNGGRRRSKKARRIWKTVRKQATDPPTTVDDERRWSEKVVEPPATAAVRLTPPLLAPPCLPEIAQLPADHGLPETATRPSITQVYVRRSSAVATPVAPSDTASVPTPSPPASPDPTLDLPIAHRKGANSTRGLQSETHLYETNKKSEKYETSSLEISKPTIKEKERVTDEIDLEKSSDKVQHEFTISIAARTDEMGLLGKPKIVHRRKVRAWQMICILSRFVDKDIMLEVTSSLHIALYRNNLPAVRQYLETVAINIYMKFPSLVREQLVPIFQDYNMRPQALSSYVFIAANVILHASATVQSSYLDELLPPIIPLLTSHHHSLRGFSQLLVYQVLSKLLPPLDSYAIMPLERRCFEDLKRYLATNSDCARLRASMEGYLDAFNPKESVTPAGIFSSRVEELEFECVPTSLMEQVAAFLNDVREDLRYSMAKDAETIKNEFLRINEDPISMKTSINADREKLQALLPKDVPLDFQKKVTISKHGRRDGDTDSEILQGENDTSKLLIEMEKEDQLLDDLLRSRSSVMEKIRGNRQHFILVASLLDRIPNLAGLARTCEVFKAAGLAIADANVVNDKQFQLISVTAEKWVPIIEVPLSNLKVFLHKKKREGFSILGLEQTANSIPLDQYVFPKKTVLVLGREKEGIPVEIIHILDACIEIPQLGVVRSLNVHVSGAIALWEYTRQQRSV
ncbi:hypothetical protein Vadar_026182 [Vaccinium darrowii]|uniref:Uncharacterized protein n=1 Tax=Vaccinium darrowii TaxID=229202 RepID=A0ACB7YGL9_9ERIC|nr:hypothetical protein Vadar_026182 [Vaccinium darrowii]